MDEHLFRQAKRYAVEKDRPLRWVMEEALRQYITRPQPAQTDASELLKKVPPFKTKPIGDLRRSSIYGDYLDKKLRGR